MKIEDQIQLYLSRQITGSRFISLILNQGMLGGIPIGQGPCKGVKLSANHFKLYDTARQFDSTSAKFYFGDAEQQSKEYLINTNENQTNTNQRDSGFIPCTDLSQIYVRFADSFVISEAVARIVEITVSDVGTVLDILNLGGLAGTIGADIAPGSDAASFADSIFNWAGSNFAFIPLPSADNITQPDATTIQITFAAGAAANSIICESNDPALSFETTQEGADAVYGSIQIEVEIFN